MPDEAQVKGEEKKEKKQIEAKEEKKEPKKTEAPHEPTKNTNVRTGQATQRPTNCIKCNKRLQRKAWYYRNGGYYCSKRCWRVSVQEAAKKKEKEGKGA